MSIIHSNTSSNTYRVLIVNMYHTNDEQDKLQRPQLNSLCNGFQPKTVFLGNVAQYVSPHFNYNFALTSDSKALGVVLLS